MKLDHFMTLSLSYVKNRFVMQPFQNPPFCSSTESSAPAQEVQSFPKTLRMSRGLIIVARCVYLKMKSHVFCGKTFNLPLLPITHVSRLFVLWLMALHVHRNIYFPSRKLDVSIFTFLVEVFWMIIFRGRTAFRLE